MRIGCGEIRGEGVIDDTFQALRDSIEAQEAYFSLVTEQARSKVWEAHQKYLDELGTLLVGKSVQIVSHGFQAIVYHAEEELYTDERGRSQLAREAGEYCPNPDELAGLLIVPTGIVDETTTSRNTGLPHTMNASVSFVHDDNATYRARMNRTELVVLPELALVAERA